MLRLEACAASGNAGFARCGAGCPIEIGVDFRRPLLIELLLRKSLATAAVGAIGDTAAHECGGKEGDAEENSPALMRGAAIFAQRDEVLGKTSREWGVRAR